MVKTIAVYGNRHQKDYLGIIERFFRKLTESGFHLAVFRRFADYLANEGVDILGASVVDEIPADAVMAVSIGGDGTFLRAAQWTRKHQTPILGINTGHLGFLASYSFSDVESIVGAIRSDSLKKERRMVLKVECEALGRDVWPYALNETAIIKSETSSMINVRAEIDGYFLADYLADGLIVSTPTGSTAYNLSVGGPIIQPTLRCMSLSPVAPHSLTMRPLVVDGSSALTLVVSSRSSECRLAIDGRSSVIPCGTPVKISQADFSVCVLRIPDSDFASILRDKLLWSKR